MAGTAAGNYYIRFNTAAVVAQMSSGFQKNVLEVNAAIFICDEYKAFAGFDVAVPCPFLLSTSQKSHA
ncbi:MAG: hypothetical protein ABSF70_02095 [Terracidiphilus sp.]|jgi:hypothetical protein